MSRIHPNGFSPWVPDTGLDLCSEPLDQSSAQSLTTTTTTSHKAMNTNVAHSATGHEVSSDRNIWDRNTWDVRRLMELDRSRNWQEQWNPRMSMSFNNTKGLLNAPGDNNCFLNSAVQVLWHLDVFRRSFRMLSGHSCLGSNSCIFCALKVIFTQFQYSDQSCLPPDALRKALAKTFADQQRFQLGLMDDAAECFENILTQIHFHIANGESEDMCNAKHCISHQKFAMTVIEQIVCPCEATSEPFPFSQMVHYVSTSTLVSQAKIANGAATFGQLLKGAISEGDYRNCPSNCGRKVQLRRTLLNSPDVVSVGLVWDSENPTSQHIHDVVWSIGTTLQLKDLFHDVTDVRCKQGSKLYLVGVVCYYGKHYSTFFYHSKMKSWVSFDDANVKEMGSDWSAIVDKCCRGHYQPLLLLYANPDADVINVETAPQNTVIVKETAFLSNNEENNSGPTGSYHCRQRSCDSLSGTIGGQCIDDSYTESIRTKRSVTPNPDSGKEKITSIPRRAITPGPEWGHYDSDNESRTPVVVHQRQSSYLNALDCVDSSEGWRAGGKTSMLNQIPAFRHHDMKATDHGNTNNDDGRSLRSQYQDQIQRQPVSSYAECQTGHRSTCGSSSQNEHPQQFVSQSQSCGITAYGSVCSGSTVTSVARSTTTYQVAASHNGSGSHYSSALYGTDYPNGQKLAKVAHTSHHTNYQQSVPTSYYSNDQKSVPTSHYPNGQQQVPTSHTYNHPICQQSVQNPHHPNGPVVTSHYSNGQKPVPLSHHSHGQPIAQALHYPKGQQSFPVSHNSDGQQPICTPHYPQDQHSIATSQHPISQQFPPTSHYSSGTQSVSLAHRANYANNGQAVPTSYHITDSGQSTPVSVASHKQPQSAPSTPGMKRAQAVENSDLSAAHGASTRPAVSRSRPSSARPYDYCNSRPTIDPNTGAIIMPSRQQPVLPAVSGTGSEWTETVLIGDFTTPDSCEPNPATSVCKKSAASRWRDVAGDVGEDVDDGYGMYINPKTVQNVLNIQQSRNVKPSTNAGMKSVAPISGIHHPVSELCDQKKQKASSVHNQALLPDLKVDIPGDNISISSHKDSGYRSGGSSGDRNSASSASSISFDSPTADNFRGYSGLHWPLTYAHNSSTHSSSESLSSTQSGQTIKNIQNNRLSLIPENQLSSSSSSLTASGSKSQESLSNSEDYVDGFTSDRSWEQSDRWHTQKQREKDMPDFAGASVNDRPDGECQKLFLQAEAMLELSTKQEESRDIHAALAYCNQAVSYLQKALSLPGISNDTSVHGRMKYNACVLRSRKLHKQILQQQHTDQSSHQSHTSVPRSSSYDGFLKSDSNKQSSTAEPRKDYTAVPERTDAPHQQPQVSSSQTAGYNRNINNIGGRMVAVSGIAQSRPVQGVTMGHANIPHSTVNLGMSQSNLHQNMETHQERHGSSVINVNSLDAKDARYVEIYGTLPKRKGRRSKSPQNMTTSSQEYEASKVHGSALDKQESSANDFNSGMDRMPAESKMENHSRMALINHSRQWSKDELRDILLKDFMNRPKDSDSQTASTNQGMTLQRRNSYDPLDNGRPSVSASPTHSRQNSCEDLLSKQMKMVGVRDKYPDLPPKQRNAKQNQAPQLPAQRIVQEESHYDYLPLRSKPNHSGSSGLSSFVVASAGNSRLSSSSRLTSTSSGVYSCSGLTSVSGMTPSSGIGVTSASESSVSSGGMTVVGITGIPNHKLSTASPHMSDRQRKQEPELKSEFHDPYSSRRELPSLPKQPTKESIRDDQKRFYPKPSALKNTDKTKSQHYVKSYEIQRPGEQGKTAVVETVPIKVNKPDTPPKPTHRASKPVKPDVPRRKSSQLSTFKGDNTAPSNPLHTTGPSNPMYDKADVSSKTGLAPPPYKPPPSIGSVTAQECDLPPPPAELLYPSPENNIYSSPAPSQPVLPKHEQHMYIDTPLTDRAQGADFENCAHSGADGQIIPTVPGSTPTKPALAKTKGATKPRKSVTFNENIALIATPEEVPQEIDYVAYVMNLGKKKCLKKNSENKISISSVADNDSFRGDDDDEEEDDDDNTSDSMDSDAVLCNLCRKKKIHPPEIYCEHCCFYMSQFQPQGS